MRRAVGVLVAVAIVLPVGLIASAVGASGQASCSAGSGSYTFGTPLPRHGDPKTVNTTVSGKFTISGCTGLGSITGGTGVQTGTVSNASWDKSWSPQGTTVITWSDGETSTIPILPWAGEPSGGVTSGLFTGAQIGATASVVLFGPNSGNIPLKGITWKSVTPLLVTFPPGPVTCASPAPCITGQRASASVSAPGVSVNVAGTPAVGVGTIQVSIASGKMPCPNAPAPVAPIVDLSDKGFATSDRITVTETLSLASSTSPEQVCFDSTLPFLSQSSPSVPALGPGLLLSCTQTVNVPPCVLSSTPVGANLVVKLVVPGGDPRFYLLVPKGRQLWASHFGIGTVGKAFTAQFQSSGGIHPITWTLASGHLPAGCIINKHTGTITGKPKVKGAFPIVVKAIDSERPPQTATISVPITII